MILLVGFYEDPALARMQEFITCLERNLANERISEVHLFLEEPGSGERSADAHPVLRHPKLRLIPHGRRSTYREMFDHANRHLAGRRAIVANADIYFDHTLARLDDVDLAGKLACLSRWDVLDDGSARFFDHSSSQDAWIFEAPMPPMACDFHLGVLGCDNRLAWEAQAAGLAVFNPGRSIRAYHLHRSMVRRYTAQERLAGPALSIASSTLGTPWLSFVVPCMGHLAGLRSTIDSLAAQRRSTCYLVDYSCPDGAGNWTSAHHPGVTVVSVPGRHRYHAAEAFNRGALAADEDAILCFLDPGVALAPDFTERVLAELPANGFMVAAGSGPEGDVAIVCRKGDFLRAGAYDEVLLDPGEDHADLAHRLRLSGVAEHTCSAALLPRRHAVPARQDWALGDAATSAAIQKAYRRVKAAILEETGAQSQPVATLREIYRNFALRRLSARGLAPNVPGAQVAFAETMGYVVAQLEQGVSSHTNDARPLAHIPAPLAGKAFTQVVAYQVSPIEVEFLSAGKLYILVGTDWYGYRPTTEWLAATAYREPLAALTTTRGTTFEVWSVIGGAGETLVIPTQAMLVADQLRRRA